MSRTFKKNRTNHQPEYMNELMKKQAFEHISYEMRRLASSYERWLILITGNGDRFETDDILELVLVHTRAVMEFLGKTRIVPKRDPKYARYDDDIISEDYGFKSCDLKIDSRIKIRIDKEVAHLSYSRCGLSDLEKAWPFHEFVPYLLSICHEFVVFAESQYRNTASADHLGYLSIAIHDLQKYKKIA